ncbi:MAG: hypothetical protein QY328_15675 [Anaerolineales bacterium]|nr:MAG: hypothetical protein QY328_15675 [Anaerolineales bacterium]
MKNVVLIGMLVFIFSACAPSSDVPVSTNTPISATVETTVVPTTTMVPVTFTSSPMPTEPVFSVITPDPTQVERWREYEDALAQAFFRSYLSPEEVVCEWRILGWAEQEVYVAALCAGIYSSSPSKASIPAVIHIRADGSVIKAEIPGSGSAYAEDIRRMFPPDVQERIFGRSEYTHDLSDRLRWRRGHPEEPPLVVFNTLSIQPTQPVIPIVSPNAIQVARWKQYQTILAQSFLSYVPSERVVCEWEILEQTDQEIYTWVICAEIYRSGWLEGLAIINIDQNGFAYNVENDIIDFPSEIREKFPLEVQERYFGGIMHFQELVSRLRWRQSHPEELPWIVLLATPTP